MSGRMVGCKDVVVVVITAFLALDIQYSNGVGTQDVCGGYNGRRLYLELGSRGYVTAQNVTLPHRKTVLSNSIQSSYYNGTSHEQCTLELVTCPGCVITVIFHHLNLSHQCSGINSVMDSPCHCDYVWLSEPPYEDVSGVPFCGIHNHLPSDGPGVMTYRSSTRTLSIVFLFSEAHANAFTFEYVTERNRQFLKGYPRENSIPTFAGNISHGGIIKSPFFPALYPRDLGIEYIMACQPDLTVSCRVRILFHDFQIDVASIMEFYDWNGQRIEISTGSAFRPPVILSSGPSLMMRFYANGGTNLGYKATYSFLSGNLLERNIKPDTDCGGYVENLGGAITMMNMVSEGIKTYDCVWLIRPPKNYLHLKTHLFLKVSTFSDMAGNTELQVLRGLTSEQPVLEMMRHPINQLLPHRNKEHIVPVDVGFYVSLRGTFGPASRLAIVYATFSYSDCFSGADTLCQNHRCIPSQLYCDGFDHCGDGSDEPSTCYQDWKTDAPDRHWYSHTPNYYFPKMERYPDLKTATLIFIISCLGLIVLITALIILLYRMGSRVRNQREIQNHLQTITDLLAANVTLDGATTEDLSPDEPPVYEAPPDYDDVIKVFISSAQTERRKLRNDSGLQPTSVPSRYEGNSGPASLDTSRPPLPETLCVNGCLALSAPGLLNITVSNAFAPAITSRSCQTTPIPDSPPPPYSHMDAVSVVEGNIYEPTTSFTVASSPLCFSAASKNRKSKLKNGRGKKFCNAWLVSREELVRNLQESLAASADHRSNESSTNAAATEANDSSLVGVHSSLYSNSQDHDSLTSSEFNGSRSTEVNVAYQLQNEANQVIDEQNLNSFSDQGSSYDSMPNNQPENYFPDASCTNANEACSDSWLSGASGLPSEARGSAANPNDLMSTNDTEDASFHCSCEGACGCATAWRNAEEANVTAQSRVSRPESSRRGYRSSSSSGSSKKSSVSSNLIWISAESQDFL